VMPPSRKAASKPRTHMDEVHAFKRRDWDPHLLARFAEICLAFPEAVEVEQFGGPWYKAGKKPFAYYGSESERTPDGEYHGVDGAAFNLTPLDQSAVLEDPRFTRPHYIGHHGWVATRWDREPDWDEVRELALSAYRKVANARQLKALEATQGGSSPPGSASAKRPKRAKTIS